MQDDIQKFSTWEDLLVMADSAPPTSMDMDLDPLAASHTPPPRTDSAIKSAENTEVSPAPPRPSLIVALPLATTKKATHGKKRAADNQQPPPQKSTSSASKAFPAAGELPQTLLQELVAIATKEGLEKALQKAYTAGRTQTPRAAMPPALTQATPTPTSWATVAATPRTPPTTIKPAKPKTILEPKPSALISMKSVALRPLQTIQSLPPKQVLAKITASGVVGAKGLRTLPSGRTEIVFASEELATAARASPD